jgi:hypothetical protein
MVSLEVVAGSSESGDEQQASSQLVFGPGAATSSSTREVAPLPLGDRKERRKARNEMRARAHRAGQPPPKSYNPAGYKEHPPLCNRVAREWGKPPQECSCKAWPGFLATALASGQAKVTNTIRVSDGVIYIAGDSKPEFAYWRPGGHNMGECYWYNGVFGQAFDVKRKVDSQTFQVAAVN